MRRRSRVIRTRVSRSAGGRRRRRGRRAALRPPAGARAPATKRAHRLWSDARPVRSGQRADIDPAFGHQLAHRRPGRSSRGPTLPSPASGGGLSGGRGAAALLSPPAGEGWGGHSARPPRHPRSSRAPRRPARCRLRRRISPITPACGAGTSSVTLSVSSSTTGSSRSTRSPGCFSHFATVASVTDSPSVGTRISTAIGLSLAHAAKRLADELRLLLRRAV